MKTYKGFMLVHRFKLLKWFKPKARVFINTFDNSILRFGDDNVYPSFQTVESGVVYKIPCCNVDVHTHDWLYKAEMFEHVIPEATKEHPVYNVMCSKEI